MISYNIPIDESNEVIYHNYKNGEHNLEYSDTNSKFHAMILDYDLNFNVKYINLIADYYNIKKTKLNKAQLIRKVVIFEIDENNVCRVEERKRLFDNFIELKNNKFFSKFIISN